MDTDRNSLANPSTHWLPQAGMLVLIGLSSYVMIEPAPYDLLAVGIAVFFFASGRTLPKLAWVPILLLLLFAATNTLSILLADRQIQGYSVANYTRYVGITLYLIVTFLLFQSFVSTYGASAVSTIWRGWTFAGVIAALAGLYGYYDLGPFSEALTRNDRAKGLFKDPNVLGPFLVPVLLYHIGRIINGTGGMLSMRIAIVLLYLFALLVTFSRGAWVNAALALAVYLPLLFFAIENASERRRLVLLTLLGAITLSFALAYLSTTPALKGMLETRANIVNPYDIKAGGRFDTQKRLIPDILRAPMGYGPNQISPSTTQAPHNVYLKAYSEYGWLGGAVWLAFSIATVLVGLRATRIRSDIQRDAIIVYASVFAIVVQGLTIDTLHWRHYFLLLGMLWAFASIKQNAGAPRRAVALLRQ